LSLPLRRTAPVGLRVAAFSTPRQAARPWVRQASGPIFMPYSVIPEPAGAPTQLGASEPDDGFVMDTVKLLERGDAG